MMELNDVLSAASGDCVRDGLHLRTDNSTATTSARLEYVRLPTGKISGVCERADVIIEDPFRRIRGFKPKGFK